MNPYNHLHSNRGGITCAKYFIILKAKVKSSSLCSEQSCYITTKKKYSSSYIYKKLYNLNEKKAGEYSVTIVEKQMGS